uniref:Uncharacterized protein n=1 Tax=Romanomermis culicivorax TaxID=13658 RepID=A0A915HR88_ROMCU
MVSHFQPPYNRQMSDAMRTYIEKQCLEMCQALRQWGKQTDEQISLAISLLLVDLQLFVANQ